MADTLFQRRNLRGKLTLALASGAKGLHVLSLGGRPLPRAPMGYGEFLLLRVL